MKKLLILMLSLCLSMFMLSACGDDDKSKKKKNSSSKSSTSQKTSDKKETEKSTGPLKVALDACYRPMEYEEHGQITGFDAELIRAVAAEMDREVELMNVGWDDIFDDLYAKKHDLIISSVTINSERERTMLFSDPYYDSMQVILTTKDSKIKNANDLSRKKVSVQKGTNAETLISKNIAGVNLKKFDSGEDAIKSFENKEVAAVVMDAPVIIDYHKQKANPDYVIVRDSSFFPKEQFGIAANKDQTKLIEDVNAALERLKDNGQYDRILKKYLETE